MDDSWIAQISFLWKPAHPAGQPPVDSIFKSALISSGFYEYTDSLAHKEVGGVWLLWKAKKL